MKVCSNCGGSSCSLRVLETLAGQVDFCQVCAKAYEACFDNMYDKLPRRTSLTENDVFKALELSHYLLKVKS